MAPSRSVLALALALLVSACGAQARPLVAARGDRTVTCHLQGTLTNGQLRASRSGMPFVDAWDAHVEAVVERTDGPLEVHAIVTQNGWRLEGRFDADRDHVLHVRLMTPLADGVTLAPGTAVQLRALRAVDARRSELLVGLPRFALSEEDGVRFVAPPERWVRCEDLGFSYPYRSPATEMAERTALGFPAMPETTHLPPAQIAALAQAPGGAPFVTLGPTDYARELFVLGTEGASTRVLLHHWTGAMLVGWVATGALASVVPDGGMGGILGGIAGPERLTACVSSTPLELFAEREGSIEPIGRLDAGARFVRDDARPDGTLVVRPHPSDGLRSTAEGVLWLARGAGALTCSEDVHDPSAGLVSVLEAPEATLRLEVVATVATGLASVGVGSACTVDVQHFPDSEPLACRATVRCGETVLFGRSPTNGFFACAFTAGAALSVSGRDPETSSGSGDPALTLDTTPATLRVEDDATGANGAFVLEARIVSVDTL